MWLLKKQPKDSPSELPTSIICVPGNWVDREDFLNALVVSSNAEYLAAGAILMHAKSHQHFTFEFCERDERMLDSFRAAGRVTEISEQTLDNITHHKHVIYISGESGSLAAAEHVARAGAALLEAGGTGIKVDSTGKAFSKDLWLKYLKNFENPKLYEMFVLDSIIQKDGTVFSCGMHNLGLRDTIVSNEEFSDAWELIRMFGYYQIVDKPVIRNNQTFQMNLSSPIFRITNENQPPYQEHELFRNPFGMWRLTRLDQ